jgi:hypothetical protein
MYRKYIKNTSKINRSFGFCQVRTLGWGNGLLIECLLSMHRTVRLIPSAKTQEKKFVPQSKTLLTGLTGKYHISNGRNFLKSF